MNDAFTPMERALDCLRVVLYGASDSDKVFLKDHLIAPDKSETQSSWRWVHPHIHENFSEQERADIKLNTDWDVFSGVSYGTDQLSEELAWIEAYIEHAYWCDF